MNRHPAETMARIIRASVMGLMKGGREGGADEGITLVEQLILGDIEEQLQVMVTLAGGRAGWLPDTDDEAAEVMSG